MGYVRTVTNHSADPVHGLNERAGQEPAMPNHMFPRFKGLKALRAVGGDGPYVIAENGRRYLDACGGAAISCLGHRMDRVSTAIANQARELAYTHPAFFTTRAAEDLADELIDGAPAGLTRVFFGCGGSEQMDGTLKMARQYCVDKGEPRRTRFIARRQSFHGNTLGALSVGGHLARREPYLPILADAIHVSACNAYRGPTAGETPATYGARLAGELDAAIRAAGPETIIAFVAETVVGAAAGALTPVPGYFRAVREICNRYGILLILDEVMCGMGRCGARYACLDEDVAPDLLVVAKGLGAGFQPISATLVSETICDTIMSGRGFFQHGHSYMAHAVACAAALEVQRVIRDDRLLDNVRVQGARLEQGLRRAFGDHPAVGDIRGRGLLLAMEFVADKATRASFAPDHAIWMRLLLAGLRHGIMCYPSQGTADGKTGDHVLLAPPFNASGDDIDEIVARLKMAIDDTFERLDRPLTDILAEHNMHAAA